MPNLQKRRKHPLAENTILAGQGWKAYDKSSWLEDSRLRNDEELLRRDRSGDFPIKYVPRLLAEERIRCAEDGGAASHASSDDNELLFRFGG